MLEHLIEMHHSDVSFVDPTLRFFPRYKKRVDLALEIFWRIQHHELMHKLEHSKSIRRYDYNQPYDPEDITVLSEFMKLYDLAQAQEIHKAINLLDAIKLMYVMEIRRLTEDAPREGSIIGKSTHDMRFVITNEAYKYIIHGRARVDSTDLIRMMLMEQKILNPPDQENFR